MTACRTKLLNNALGAFPISLIGNAYDVSKQMARNYQFPSSIDCKVHLQFGGEF